VTLKSKDEKTLKTFVPYVQGCGLWRGTLLTKISKYLADLFIYIKSGGCILILKCKFTENMVG
jgi:hypothetical protein